MLRMPSITNFNSLFVSHALILEKLVIERKAPTELVCIFSLCESK